jgi:acetylornithine deacetylase
MDVLDLTRRLIAIPSISGDEEDVAEFIAEYLNRAGFRVELQHAEDHRPNVYARIGEPDVVLSTHTDTVPPYVEFREDEEYIYGRGACDAKGIIAAMIKAAESVLAGRVADFGLLFLVGEEAGSQGARVANAIPNRCRFLINGEPTESRLALGSKGALKVFLRAQGRAAHSAYPEMGESAIEKIIDVLNELRGAQYPADEILGATTVNIGSISGGIAANVIPAEAQAELLFRVVGDLSWLKQRIEQAASNRAIVEYRFECPPIVTEKLDGFETTVVSFTTDIPMLTRWGKPLLFGPGSILDAHTPHERISKRELRDAVNIYQEMVTRLKRLKDDKKD